MIKSRTKVHLWVYAQTNQLLLLLLGQQCRLGYQQISSALQLLKVVKVHSNA
jgi:hypothetical protein